MKRIAAIILLIVLQKIAVSQITDTIRASLEKTPTLTFRFDNRGSIISNNGALIKGYKIGLNFENKVKLGIGYNYLDSRISRMKYLSDDFEQGTYNAQLKFNYIDIYGEYVFHNTHKWEFCIPIQFGFGRSWYQHKTNGRILRTEKVDHLIYETNLSGYYKVVKWLGVGGGIGYRLLFFGKQKIDENFTSAIYLIRVKLYPHVLYERLFRKQIDSKDHDV